MNHAQHDALVEYIKYALSINLELGEWKFAIVVDPEPDASAYAGIYPVEGRKLATIRVCSEFFSLPPATIRHVLLHECLHLCHQDMTNVVRLGLHNVLGQQAYDVIWEPFRLATEIMVDQLAYAFEDYFAEYPRENRLLWAIVGQLPPPRPDSECRS